MFAAGSCVRKWGAAFGTELQHQAGISPADLRSFFKGALVSPVLTAHPTEVRRKSTMDREMEIADLLDRRERLQMTPDESDASDEQLRRAVVTPGRV